jgi:PhnB protein
MATRTERSVPEGMSTVTPYLWYNGNCKDAIAFYEKAFSAHVIGQIAPSPDGKTILHAMMTIGDSKIMLSDVMDPTGPERGPSDHATTGFWVYVDDCDALFKRALDAGCTQLMPMEDQFWGDRMGKVRDPFGHCWAIATHVWIYTQEEMQSAMDKLQGWT